MHKIKIVTDSTCDIPAELIKKYNITVVPLKVIFADKIYRDGIDISNREFYQLLSASTLLPTTSQPAPGEFVAVYENLINEGYQIISIHLSGELSGTYQSAQIAAQMVPPNNVQVIDSRNVSMALGLIVLEAAKMAMAGKNYDEIISYVNNIKEQVSVYFMVDTLDNLVKGGRIGKATAFIGSLLNIKPILSFNEGAVVPVEKVRGQNKALEILIEKTLAQVKSEIICSIVHADAEETLNILVEKFSAKIKPKELIISQISPVIGTHGGKGTIGIVTLPL